RQPERSGPVNALLTQRRQDGKTQNVQNSRTNVLDSFRGFASWRLCVKASQLTRSALNRLARVVHPLAVSLYLRKRKPCGFEFLPGIKLRLVKVVGRLPIGALAEHQQ